MPGLVLRPFRALRPTVDAQRLGRLLCPPYDVIDGAQRAALLEADPANAVGLVLPDEGADGDRYEHARRLLDEHVRSGLWAADTEPALYVYEMRDRDGAATRGLLGAVELRRPEEDVILPHENTMAGPVADRFALMAATQANLEPIYLVYDGGGAASNAVAGVTDTAPIATATTPDGTAHTLWAITDPSVHAEIAEDLRDRRALIADGHHRYATYLDLQQRYDAERGPGPWDFGLTLLVDSTSYGPQVHAIHRVLVGTALDDALAALEGKAQITRADSPAGALAALDDLDGFAIALSDGDRSVIVHDVDGTLVAATRREGEPASLAGLDVTVLHRTLVEQVWKLDDNVEVVGFAHSVDEALALARQSAGTAVLMRPTPVAEVAAVAAAGARMPRKSTLFTPKPASGLVIRRYADA
jgi:uncharacterized protein (DUF1015 family)